MVHVLHGLHPGLFAYSDGAGRSGVYIAIDANIELCEEDGLFDVYGYLKKVRGLRRGLVETLVRFPSRTAENYDSTRHALLTKILCFTVDSFF
jgi:hypothetical protein